MTIIEKMWNTSPVQMRLIIQITGLISILGMAIGPQIARPFIGREGHYSPTNDTVNVTTSTLRLIVYEELHPVQFLYLLMSTLNSGTAIICVSTGVCVRVSSGNRLCTCFEDNGKDIQTIPDSADISTHGDGQLPVKLEPRSRQGCVLLVIIALFCVLNGGYSVILTSLVYSYVYLYLGWSADAGTMLLTLKDAVHFVSSAVVMFLLSRWMSPTKQVNLNIVSMLIASVLMSAALLDERTGFLTAVGVIITGLGSYSTCSMIIMLVDETVRVRADILAVSAFGLGSMFLPPLSGTLVYYTSAISFPLLMLGLTSSGLVLFGLYNILSRAR